MSSENVKLFTDGSVNTKTKVGVGAYLVSNDSKFELELLKKAVKTKQFEDTSSTKLELQTLLWALDEIQKTECSITIYTDSQNIIRLLDRRLKLENNNYFSKNNVLLKNHLLYQQFYLVIDQLNCTFEKVKGHKQSKEKDVIDKTFSIVDRAARSGLKKLT